MFQELEDLLETIFAQVDRTLSRIQAMEEQISGQETYITVDLDSKRNTLFEVMVVTTFWNTVVLQYTNVTGIFAMNMRQQGDSAADYAELLRRNRRNIPQVNIACGVIVVVVCYLFVHVLRKKRVLLHV